MLLIALRVLLFNIFSFPPKKKGVKLIEYAIYIYIYYISFKTRQLTRNKGNKKYNSLEEETNNSH